MKIYLSLCLALVCSLPLSFSQKKLMTQEAYSEWNEISGTSFSNNGEWVKFNLVPGKGNSTLKVRNTKTGKSFEVSRINRSLFTDNSSHLIYSVEHDLDALTTLRRNKVDKKDLPKDTLIIMNLSSNEKIIIPHLSNYKVPQKWSGIVALQAKMELQDTSSATKNEERFLIVDLNSGSIDTLENVDGYFYAQEATKLIYHRSVEDSDIASGVFMYDYETSKTNTIYDGQGKFSQIAADEMGNNVSFIADLDTTERRERPYQLFLWNHKAESAQSLVDYSDRINGSSKVISQNQKPSFSKDGKLLYFGLGERPILGDSLALPEDEVSVEVWTTEDPMLYTMQVVQKSDLEKKAYEVMYDLATKKFQILENENQEGLRKSNEGNGPYYLVSNSKPYSKSVTWEGRTRADLFLIDGRSGDQWIVEENIAARTNFSPGGKYLYWFDRENLDWFTYDIEAKKKVNLTAGMEVSFVDELHDSPSRPNAYGSAGWTKEDGALLIYDRYDIWSFDPTGNKAAIKLTDGRKETVSTRLITLDRDARTLDKEQMVFLFDDSDKSSGYGTLDLESKKLMVIEKGPFSHSRRPSKAKDSDELVFTKESFERFPDLILTNTKLENQTVISNANPQQSEYRWGTIELFEWKDKKGILTKGLLVKPEGFDPMKKYPVIVNFYETSTNGLHRHRAPEPHRSTINYSYYANKGYIIFNPDVRYEIGYPGQSCYNAVVSGVEALSKNQFIDTERIGVQGHSWGGYQIAYLLNKTDLFKCAESGAPVVNMVSAYGGIRWGSGMSRMFQYEKTQSRLGATLWENPELYLENSPIFEMDKTNTPVLILHNDNDSAVPWYQGIEYFMALRRLNKPAWFLNYNGEPHWPLKWENRLDFNKRMEQFFAHYLLDQPMPMWMKRGVPITEKGVRQGFELEDKK